MKTKLFLLALIFAFSLEPSALHAQGSLTPPPGVPTPTMLTLSQVEPRTPISSVPFTITQPGSYYLTANVTLNFANAITISTNGVTLDLNGFTISSTEASPSGAAILLGGGISDITILNGHIRGGVTNNAGVYGGSGFGYGIFFFGSTPVNVRVAGVSVSGCRYYGIYPGYLSVVVESCTVQTVGSEGIIAGSVFRSMAFQCGADAIYVYDTASDCYGNSSGNGAGVTAATASNCYGYSSTGGGLVADTANNCCGVSFGSGTGLSANYVATGCYGQSSSGTGLSAFIASVCHGVSATGTALNATHNVNSY
jgi:hypothetical protein